MSIKGQLQAVKINDYGYAAIKVSNTWYGGDKKGPVSVDEGDIVEFDNFKNAKNYDTYKSASLKKVAGKPANTGPVDKGSVASKDEYWSAKEARDLAVEPRINYFAALDRAISFVDLALRNGAVGAYEKAKATGKLEVLSALVYETTQRMIKEAYEQRIPSKSVGGGSNKVSEKGDRQDESDRGADDASDSTGDDDSDDSQWS